MTTVYIADDGKQFEDEYECEHHEFELKHPHLQTIEAYNKDGEKMTDLMDEDTYNNCEKIILHSEEELTDLYEAADYAGFSGYYDIKDVGTWIFDKDKEKFVKYVNPTFNQELSDKYVKNLKEYTTAYDHEYADEELIDLLVELGYTDVVEEYKTVPKWYS